MASRQAPSTPFGRLALVFVVAGSVLGPVLGFAPTAAPAGLPTTRDITLDPTFGAVGDPVTVTGTGWDPALGDVTVYLKETPTGAEVWLTESVDELGGFFDEATVPALEPGSYRFLACQDCVSNVDGGYPAQWVSFQVIPPESPVGELTLDPTTGSPGSTIEVTGTGWSIDAGPVLLFASFAESSNPELRVVKTDPTADGTLATSFEVPVRPAGVYTFYGCQLCDLGEKAPSVYVDFQITPGETPKLAVDPDRAVVGRQVTVSGTGWSDAEGLVSVYADRSDLSSAKPLATATVTGGEFSTVIEVPDRDPGSLLLYACQRCDEEPLEAETPFRIRAPRHQDPTLAVAPDSVKSGERVTLSGTGWLPRNGAVTVFLGPTDASDLADPAWSWLTLDPGRDGTFSTTADAPDRDADDYQVFACQHCGDTAGFPQATAPLAVTGGRSNLWTWVVGLVLVWLVVRWFRRPGPPAEPGSPDQPDRVAPDDRPTVHATVDDELEAAVGPAAGISSDVELPSLDVVPCPDPRPLADQVEVKQ